MKLYYDLEIWDIKTRRYKALEALESQDDAIRYMTTIAKKGEVYRIQETWRKE